MTAKGIEHFRELEDWTIECLKKAGYKRYSVSIFNHWLTREEWDSNPFVSWERACANGLASIYRAQNRQFREFYRCVFENGAFRTTGLRSKPQVVWHDGWDRRLKKAVIAMVEDRKYGSQFYAPARRVRIISDDARTDTLLLEEGADVDAIRALATSHDLNLIS